MSYGTELNPLFLFSEQVSEKGGGGATLVDFRVTGKWQPTINLQGSLTLGQTGPSQFVLFMSSLESLVPYLPTKC